MPSGKTEKFGGAPGGRLPGCILVSSMGQWVQNGVPTLTTAELAETGERLYHALNRYQLATRQVSLTPTEQRKLLRKLRTSASRLRQCPTSESWARRFLDALELRVPGHGTHLDTVVLVSRYLSRNALDLCSLMGSVRKYVESQIDGSRFLSADDVAALKLLAELPVEQICPRSAAPDPAFLTLVGELTPLWKRTTGRSPRPGTDPCGEERHPFADWLLEVLEQLKLPLPPRGRIADATAALKPKNPVPTCKSK